MSEFQPFVMERMMSKYEQAVDFNLSESGVHPMRVSEVLADRPGAVEDLVATELNYPHVNGIPELREHIAAMYEGCGPDNVLVTTGHRATTRITACGTTSFPSRASGGSSSGSSAP